VAVTSEKRKICCVDGPINCFLDFMRVTPIPVERVQQTFGERLKGLQHAVVWTGLIWLRIRTADSSCKHGNEPSMKPEGSLPCPVHTIAWYGLDRSGSGQGRRIALVNTVMNLLASWNIGKFLNSSPTGRAQEGSSYKELFEASLKWNF
jgi:hypothetical protein